MSPALRQILLPVLLASFLGQSDSQSANCRFSWYIPPNGRLYTLRSPNYPNNYNPGSVCYWYLYTDPGFSVSLTCPFVNINANDWGCTDTLVVTGSTGDGTYCSPFSVDSRGNRILVTLTSDSQSDGGQFACNVRVPTRNDCDCGWSYRTKIVGGVETGVNEFPFMVSLIDVVRRSHTCGATIISPTWVLTASHCLDVLKPSTTGVLVGEHDMSTGSETNATALYRVKGFYPHPGWNPSTTSNDIALIEVARPIQFSVRVGPVCLPFNMANAPQLGDVLTVTGWGTLFFGGPTSNTLQKTDVRVVNVSRCQAAFNNRVSPSTQFCTFERGKDSCQMDSGGPLLSSSAYVSRHFQVGITSYGGACAGDDPSVSTRVAAYLAWIRATTGDSFCVK